MKTILAATLLLLASPAYAVTCGPDQALVIDPGGASCRDFTDDEKAQRARDLEAGNTEPLMDAAKATVRAAKDLPAQVEALKKEIEELKKAKP